MLIKYPMKNPRYFGEDKIKLLFGFRFGIPDFINNT